MESVQGSYLEDLSWEETMNVHESTFGKGPEFSGIRFGDDVTQILNDVKQAILNGKPYVDEDVPDGVII